MTDASDYNVHQAWKLAEERADEIRHLQAKVKELEEEVKELGVANVALLTGFCSLKADCPALNNEGEHDDV